MGRELSDYEGLEARLPLEDGSSYNYVERYIPHRYCLGEQRVR